MNKLQYKLNNSSQLEVVIDEILLSFDFFSDLHMSYHALTIYFSCTSYSKVNDFYFRNLDDNKPLLNKVRNQILNNIKLAACTENYNITYCPSNGYDIGITKSSKFSRDDVFLILNQNLDAGIFL